MFRVLCAVLALIAGLTVTAAYANPQACRKADIRFACRSGATGSVTLDCAQGENAEQCCARYRRRASDPRRGFCTGRDGGVVRFVCDCAGGGRGAPGRVREIEPLGGEDAEDEPRRRRLLEADPGDGPGAGGGRLLPREEAGPRRCPRVGYVFACKRDGSGSGQLACRGGENERACCARIERLVSASCKGKGGLARFRCACPGDGGEGRARIRER